MALQKRMAAALREEDFEVAQFHDFKMSTTDKKSDKVQSDTNFVSYYPTLQQLLSSFLAGNCHSRSD